MYRSPFQQLVRNTYDLKYDDLYRLPALLACIAFVTRVVAIELSSGVFKISFRPARPARPSFSQNRNNDDDVGGASANTLTSRQ